LSNDGLEVVIDLTVLYRVSAVDAPRILKEIGGYRIRLRPRQVHVSVTMQFIMIALYSTKRVEFQDRILKLFKLTLKQEDLFLSSC
jgi:hypothetical protein